MPEVKKEISSEVTAVKLMDSVDYRHLTKPLPTPPVQSAPSLVEAVNMVYRAASARIATLQSEIDALRKAMQPFAQMGKFSSPPMEDGDPLMKELISIAQRLPNGQ